jgi:death-on-curing protein
MSRFNYLDIDDILAIHSDQLSLFGGGGGVRDVGQLKAAIFRPQAGYYDDLIAEAAALWESLAMNHPFIDGNKRTALVSAGVFLYLNGLRIVSEDRATWQFILGAFEKGEFNFKAIDSWLRENTAAL